VNFRVRQQRLGPRQNKKASPKKQVERDAEVLSTQRVKERSFLVAWCAMARTSRAWNWTHCHTMARCKICAKVAVDEAHLPGVKRFFQRIARAIHPGDERSKHKHVLHHRSAQGRAGRTMQESQENHSRSQKTPQRGQMWKSNRNFETLKSISMNRLHECIQQKHAV